MFRPLTAFMALCAVFLLTTGTAATASPWPGSDTGTDIGGDLPSDFEPSGIVWDDFTGALWVVGGDNKLARMLDDGTSTDHWEVSDGSDLEAVAVTGTALKVYLGQEYPPKIWEYNSSSTGTPTFANKSWQLDLDATASDGMEGLTWVPNGYHPYPASASGGLFFASSQKNGTIYVYNVNLSTTGNGTLSHLASFKPDTQNDISDLYFSPSTRTLFVLYDAKVIEIDTTTTSYSIMSTYTLPATTAVDGHEGVTLLPQCPGAVTNIYIADDDEGDTRPVYLFNNFPQLCATTLAPTADATTKQASPNTNFGTQTTLSTDAATNDDDNFLIRFSLSGINTANINRARLLFYATDGTDSSPHYCGTTTSWTESGVTGVTWNNQPVCNTNNLGGGATVADNSWVSYDVRSALQGGFASFRFKPQSTNDCVANSRQAGSNRPQLVLWMNQ